MYIVRKYIQRCQNEQRQKYIKVKVHQIMQIAQDT